MLVRPGSLQPQVSKPTYTQVSMSVLEVQNLNVQIPTEDGTVHAVQNVSFTVEAGEFFGVVGESGSGKSVMVQAVLGLLPGAKVSGHVYFEGRDLLAVSAEEMRKLRGREISMIFQDPLSSLHPQYTIGKQLCEQIHIHERISKEKAKSRAVEMLRKVGIPSAAARFDSYPHQFSGGMRQRVMIAMALILNPKLIIADEPTTALDSTVQAQILNLMNEMRKEFNTTIIMISHDLAVLSRVADRSMVMYAGNRLEHGNTQAVFEQPAHPYTAGLLRSTPANYEPGSKLVPITGRPPSLLNLPTGCVFASRCPDVMAKCRTQQPPQRVFSDGGEAACWLDDSPSTPMPTTEEPGTGANTPTGEAVIDAKAITLEYTSGGWGRRRQNQVLKGIDLTIQRGETLGLVGESGCGKSTLARVLAGLIPATSGTVTLAGHELAHIDHREWRNLRKEVQLVFQDPFGALNPRRRVGAIIGDPFRIHNVCSGGELKRRVQNLMEIVGLNPEHYNRFPADFSGGQRQRIGIARAIALNPSIVIYDEPVSALDVSIQAQILNLMDDLQKEFGMTYLFISHDLAVVRHVCDRIAVMDKGKVIELATAEQIYTNPQTDFTKTLLAAAMPPAQSLEPQVRRQIATKPAVEVSA